MSIGKGGDGEENKPSFLGISLIAVSIIGLDSFVKFGCLANAIRADVRLPRDLSQLLWFWHSDFSVVRFLPVISEYFKVFQLTLRPGYGFDGNFCLSFSSF